MSKNILLIAGIELKQRKKSIITWSIVFSAIMFVYMILFHSFKNALIAEIEMFPEEILEMFSMSRGIDYSNFNNYYGMIAQIVLIALCAYGAYLGASVIGDEKRNKTIEYLNANPVSRKEIVIGKVLAMFTILVIINFSQFIVGVLAGFISASKQVAIISLLGANLISFLVILVFGMLGVLLASLNKSGRAQGISLGAFFATYIIGYFSTLGIKWLKWCKWLSPVDFLNQTEFISSKYGVGEGSYNFIGIIICVILIVCFMTFSLIIYKRKDL